MIIVGYLVPFTVLRGQPDYDSYLVKIINNEVLCLLPRKYAMKEYKVGESGWAAVFKVNNPRVILSQKSPQYVRKILEYLLEPLIRDGKIKLKRVAKLAESTFYKVAIETSNGTSQRELVEMCKPYLGKIHEYISEKVILVKFSEDIGEYIANAMAPAPIEEIRKVIVYKVEYKAKVEVEEKLVGYFLGHKGKNVSTARKLTGFEIIINKDIENE